ncbi:AraC family transcriptional regulator [Mucilaginibacter pallidiroseus]|uniref:AraC family transcriptional regulator n=1 Tax=Mucilaginibacter pallidiroseus TaxID=2599295 RepID=A0A563U3I6_9SPHI|nr:helix-turn-helix domain-containing protein [Mucilaginibacter pallidiroseus]TWR25904.1 AraC family transcriptional regulator [Mucilaginibacter pallidiroseus]
MQHLELRPPDKLKNLIHGFWYLEKEFGQEPIAFEVLPDGNAEIIFYFGSELTLKNDDQGQIMPSPFVVGLLGRTVNFYAKNRLKIIGIKCFPWAVYDLLGLQPVPGGVISSIAHPIASLQNELGRILDQGNIAQALDMVKDWFLDNCTTSFSNSVLIKAGKAMQNGNGALPVSAVAQAAHSTVRTLERKFKAASGHTVKDVSGLMRFEQARDRLWGNPELNIAGLAYELGYADQSHLNREFKRYSGTTAAAFAKQTKARKERLGDDFVAIVLSSPI